MYRLSCLIYNGTLIRVPPMEENVRNSKLEKRQFLPHYLSDKVLLDTIVNQACFSGNGG